jgi:hypothetical protein
VKTNDQLLAESYPQQIERIRALSTPKYLAKPAELSGPNSLSCAFLWHETEEGWEFWNDLYERGPSPSPVTQKRP